MPELQLLVVRPALVRSPGGDLAGHQFEHLVEAAVALVLEKREVGHQEPEVLPLLLLAPAALVFADQLPGPAQGLLLVVGQRRADFGDFGGPDALNLDVDAVFERFRLVQLHISKYY